MFGDFVVNRLCGIRASSTLPTEIDLQIIKSIWNQVYT